MNKDIKELRIVSTESDGISLNTKYFGKTHPYISYTISYNGNIINNIINKHYGLVYSSTLESLLSNLGWGLQYTPYLDNSNKYIITEKSAISSLIGLSIPESINDDTSIIVKKDEEVSFSDIKNLQEKLYEFFLNTYDIDYSISSTIDLIRSGESTYSSFLNLNEFISDDSEYMITIGLSYSKENNKKLYYTTSDNSILEINDAYKNLISSNEYSENTGGIITFNSEISEIPDNFWGNNSLESIIIPDSICNIGKNDFNNCLMTLRPVIPPEIDITNTFEKIYVPRNSKSAYNKSWTEYENIIIDYQRTYNKQEVKLVSRIGNESRDCVQHSIGNDILIELLNKRLRIFIKSKDVVECIIDYCYIDKM